MTATDVDSSSLAYSVSGSNFAITTDGILTFISAPDYESKTSYIGSVSVTDGNLSTTQSITVTINNLNDNSPVFTSSATFNAAENQTAIGTVTATDAEGDSLTFIVSGSELAITSAGVLSFASAPDYETKEAYTATVTASDGTNTSTQDITVNVTNINELIDHLIGLNNQYKHAFAKRGLIKIAVNKNYSPFETKINNNDEVAFFPPVTGG